MIGDLLVISGSTGVGKTSFGLELAKNLNIEIISADSMQIYRGLNIGTSKLTKEEAQVCPHHMIDIVSPFENYNTYQYVKDAQKIIKQVWERGNLPVVLGGTGLYIESLIKQYSFEKDANDNKKASPYNLKHICLCRDRAKMYQAINDRVDNMIKQGLVNEVKALHEMGVKDDAQCMRAIGYKEICRYLNNEISLEQAISDIKKNSRNYAKRQVTWFRHMDCEWVDVDTQKDKALKNLEEFYKEYKKTHG
ncbi:MAG: tRNA dimethylallyltransferase [Clostridia bacterium]|nr:tRNA dimethylallyltransferase [Clostridia bacterium]